MNKTARRTIVVLLGLTFVVGGVIYSTNSYADVSNTSSTSVTPAKKLSQKELEDLNKNIGEIHTPNGVFIRSSEVPDFDSSQIANNEEDVTSETKAIITSYGTFIKSNDFKVAK